MDFIHQILSDRGMNRAMAGDTRQRSQGRGFNHHAKMALATILIPGMAPMAIALINHLQMTRRKGAVQPVADFLRSHHFSGPAPFNPLRKTLDCLFRVEKV